MSFRLMVRSLRKREEATARGDCHACDRKLPVDGIPYAPVRHPPRSRIIEAFLQQATANKLGVCYVCGRRLPNPAETVGV